MHCLEQALAQKWRPLRRVTHCSYQILYNGFIIDATVPMVKVQCLYLFRFIFYDSDFTTNFPSVL
jgi:hypothetical protein